MISIILNTANKDNLKGKFIHIKNFKKILSSVVLFGTYSKFKDN